MAPTLKIWSNPWHAVDHEGRPCGAATVATSHQDNSVRFIGATRKVKTLGPAPVDGMRKTLTDVTFEFSAEVVELEDGYDQYHRRLVREGAVFAADKATADTCGVPFLPYEKQIERAVEGARARHRMHHGVDLPGYPKIEEPKEPVASAQPAQAAALAPPLPPPAEPHADIHDEVKERV